MHWSVFHLLGNMFLAMGIMETVSFFWYERYRRRVMDQAREAAKAKNLDLHVICSADFADDDKEQSVLPFPTKPSIVLVDGAFATMEDADFERLASVLREFDGDCVYSVHRPYWSLSAYLNGSNRVVLCEPPTNTYVLVKGNAVVKWPWWSMILLGALSANFICSV